MKTIYRCEATIVAVSMQKTALHLLHHLRGNLHIKWLEKEEKSCKKPFFKDDCIFCQIAAKALKRKKRIGSSEDGKVMTSKVFHWIVRRPYVPTGWQVRRQLFIGAQRSRRHQLQGGRLWRQVQFYQSPPFSPAALQPLMMSRCSRGPPTSSGWTDLLPKGVNHR